MKILHVITSLKMGGAEAALFSFLAYTIKNYSSQHQVAYIYDGPYVEKIRALGIPVYCIRGWFLSYDLGTYVKLCRLVKAFGPDIIHSSLWAANLLSRALAHRFSLPLISELHGDCRHVSARWKNWLDLETISGLKHQRIVAVSDCVAQAYQQTIINSIKDRYSRDQVSQQLIIIKNGIDATALRQRAKENPLSRSELGLNHDDFVIGSVGRLEAIKSYDLLLQAFKLVAQSNMKLCLIGDGAERTKLEQLACSLGIKDQVLFFGQRIDAYRFYELFDCFALSSQTEGLSLALLEAMAFGLPIITTHTSISHEVIIDGINGLLIANNNSDAYALGIKKLYDFPELRSAMHQANLSLITSFDLGCVVARYQKLYREIY